MYLVTIDGPANWLWFFSRKAAEIFSEQYGPAASEPKLNLKRLSDLP